VGKVSEGRAISGVTFFGLKCSARAAACSAVELPPHVVELNDNDGEMTERRERTGGGNPTNDKDNNGKGNDNVDDFSHGCNREGMLDYT
jgi:hypothetical protein